MKRLLIVDDGAAARSLESALETEGFAVDVATDASVAMKRIESDRYDAILLDPMLRGRMNGFTVLSFVELDHPELAERTFLTTSLCQQTVLHTAPALLPRFFRKPLDVNRLVKAIRSLESSDASAGTDSSPRVLIAEDDASTALVLAELLRQRGYATSIAENGREAIHHLTASEYSTIIVDLIMPDVDGFALLQYIEEARPALVERVIVSTGIPDRFLSFLSSKRIRGVLHKPIRLAELNELLESNVARVRR